MRLTKKGQDTVPHARAAWRELERRATSRLDAEQKRRLSEGFAAVRDALNDIP